MMGYFPFGLYAEYSSLAWYMDCQGQLMQW